MIAAGVIYTPQPEFLEVTLSQVVTRQIGETATRRLAPASSATKSTIGGCGSFVAAAATTGPVEVLPIEVGPTPLGVCGVLTIGPWAVGTLGVSKFGFDIP